MRRCTTCVMRDHKLTPTERTWLYDTLISMAKEQDEFKQVLYRGSNDNGANFAGGQASAFYEAAELVRKGAPKL